jgi:hypothetical protein
MMRMSSVYGAAFLLAGFSLNVPAQALSSPDVAIAQFASTQAVPLSAQGAIPERKGSAKWCSKHPRKCAATGGMPPL